MGLNKQSKWISVVMVIFCVILIILLDPTEGKKSTNGNNINNNNKRTKEDYDEESGRPNRLTSDSERSKLFAGLQDPETSAQGINQAVQNPLANQLLYQNQGGLYNGGALGGGFGGGLANLGGGLFSNQGIGGNPYLNGYQNPYGNLGGLGGGLGGYGGLAGLGGVAPDIYTQGALAAQLYNNPLYGAGANSLTGAAAGINPLLLRGAQNQQYPVVGGLGGLGAYNNPYLAAQALLSPYSNYNQLYNYPFSSRFGIGAGSSGRSGLSRYNSQSSGIGSRNNDE